MSYRAEFNVCLELFAILEESAHNGLILKEECIYDPAQYLIEVKINIMILVWEIWFNPCQNVIYKYSRIA